MTHVYMHRTNEDGTVEQILTATFYSAADAEDYADSRNSALADAGIPGSIASYYTV